MNPDLVAILVCCLSALVIFALIRTFTGLRPNALGRGRLSFGPLTHVFALLIPILFESKSELKKDLIRAGYYQRHALREYLANRNVLVLAWCGLTAVIYIAVVAKDPSLKVPILVLGTVVAVIFYSVPRLMLHAQSAGRLRRIQHALPDALDLITMSMTGGLPLVQALDRVSREISASHPDLGCELTIVKKQMEAGSLDLALQQFAQRIDIVDVQSLAALIGQTERLGANIAAAFHEYSDSVRRGLRQSAEERGNKASVKLLLPIIFCLAPPVYILLLSPALLELRNFVVEQNEPGGVLAQDVDVSVPNSIRVTQPESPSTEGRFGDVPG